VDATREIKIALAGNPNSGKTSIFNCLTGAHQRVANFPGVTVEKRIGHKKYKSHDITFIDLPGTYSLTAYSLDEKVARDFIINEKPDLIINVIDSGNLERSLYLTTQLMEMGVNLVIDLNMWDEAVENGIEIDTEKMSLLLRAPVVKTIANRNQGIDKLLDACVDLYTCGCRDGISLPISYGPQLDDIVTGLTHHVKRCPGCRGCHNPRWMAIKLLEGDKEITSRYLTGKEAYNMLSGKVNESLKHIKSTTEQDPEIVITEGRYGYVAGIIREVMRRSEIDRMKISNQVDQLLTHKILGYPIFLFLMWLIFQATFRIGEYPMHWIETGVTALQGIMVSILPKGIWADMIVDGIIGGVGSVIVFLPNIVILFLGISLLEDSGYMSRAAFLMDRPMHFMGLHGKSFIPLLMGFGCAVPAIMSTRTLESQRDRILTTLLTPFMSCSARLPVYILFAGAFFGIHAGNVIFSIYLLGIATAVVLGKVFKKTILSGEDIPFVMELPPYRWPTVRSVLIHMWERTQIYLKKMGGVILIASIILWALGYFPRKETFDVDYDAMIIQAEQSALPDKDETIASLKAERASEILGYSYIGRLGYAIEPFVTPIGFNWQMGVSLITGFVAKEVVVSSMGVLYQLGADIDEKSNSLIAALQDPEKGITPLVAYTFMVFVLLYTPCIVSILAIRREIGMRWMWFAVVFQLILAWLAAFVIYQGGRLLGLG
jgi:ferrous iron transport protein B